MKLILLGAVLILEAACLWIIDARPRTADRATIVFELHDGGTTFGLESFDFSKRITMDECVSIGVRWVASDPVHRSYHCYPEEGPSE